MRREPNLYKFTLVRVRLNAGGYDSMGRYFGRDIPLWHYSGEVECDRWEWARDSNGHMVSHAVPDTKPIDEYLRAVDRDDAKACIKQKYPHARFYR